MTEFTVTAQTGQPALEAALQNLAEDVLCTIIEDAFCIVQEWDNRIDCCIKLDNGRIVGEMVPLATLDSNVIRAVGERLKLRKHNESSELRNELWPPILISG